MEITELADKSDDELYEILGAEVEGDSLGFGPGDLWRLRTIGKEWFDDHFEDLQKAVCRHPVALHFSGYKGGDWAADALAILPALETVGEKFYALPVLAVLIARIGISSFCHNAPQP